MKIYAILSFLALTACATQPSSSPPKSGSYELMRQQLLADLDDPKYRLAPHSEADADRAVCASDKTLACMDITRDVCRKIYNKELTMCIAKKAAEKAEIFDPATPFNKGYLQGCAALGSLKYGKNDLRATLSCIQN